jgi:hypothetical protein
MPATPFHFGPAALLKPVLRSSLSLTVFAIVQIAIDVEVAVRIVTGSSTLHAALHTFLGAFLLSLLLLVPARYVATWTKQAVRLRLGGWHGPKWLLDELGPVTWMGAFTGAILGGISHVVFDAMVHMDVHPLAPWSSENPLFVPGSFVAVHILFVAVGVAGVAVWYVVGRRSDS